MHSLTGVPSRGRLRAALIGLVVMGALLAAGASSASAVIVHLPNGKTLSYQPLRGQAKALARAHRFDTFFSNLDYNGGPVMPSNTNYTVYWRPAVTSAGAYPGDYQPGVNRYLEDLQANSGGHENVDSVATQYNDAAGEFANYESHFGGALIDTEKYPTSGCTRATICLTDAQIQKELERFVAEQKRPTDLSHEYFLLTPPGVESCFDAAGKECSAGIPLPFGVYCAYHGSFATKTGAKLVYSNDPYVTGNGGCDDGNHPNGSTSDGALQGGLSHEHNESITDPEPNNAWTDFAMGESTGFENGDKCGEEKGPFIGVAEPKAGETAVYNQEIAGHFYWYQEEWSNQGHECLQRLTFNGARPTATFTAAPGAGSAVSLNAGGSTAPGGVKHYDWQFNDFSEPGTPEETTAPTTTHLFPGPGRYNVALTVFAEDGTSAGTARTVDVGKGAPTAAFSVATPSPTAGAPVSFDGSASSTSEGTITAYEWSFGDGGLGSGATPTHVYASGGTYEVSLTVTNTAGFSSAVSHALGVAFPSPAAATTTTTTTTASTTAVIAQAPTASVSLNGSSVGVQGNGQGAIKLSCSGTAPVCSGELALTTKRTIRVHGRKRTQIVKLATIRFSILAGRTTTLKFKLGASVRALLRASGGHLSATAVIRKTSPSPAQTRASSIRLNALRSGRKH
jgi:PKD repeat protein